MGKDEDDTDKFLNFWYGQTPKLDEVCFKRYYNKKEKRWLRCGKKPRHWWGHK